MRVFGTYLQGAFYGGSVMYLLDSGARAAAWCLIGVLAGVIVCVTVAELRSASGSIGAQR